MTALAPLAPLSLGLYRTRNGRTVELVEQRAHEMGWFGRFAVVPGVLQSHAPGRFRWLASGVCKSKPGPWDLVERIDA